MKMTHQLSNDSQYRRDLRVLLIGSGGNGSAILFGLPYLHHALVAWGKAGGIDVTVMDADTVSPTNCVRQPFGAADVGHNKATILVNRVNLFHGLSWRSVEVFFSKDLSNNFSSYDNTIDVVISCVDTRAARREMHEAFNTKSGPWRHVRYWLDIGNNTSDGQFVLGQPLNDLNRQSRARLLTVTELFPSIMDTSQGEGPLPSCSAAEALERQEPFINNVLATSALAMLTRLLRYGTLDHHGAFYNAATGRAVPLPIDPDIWEKQQAHRRRRLAKAA
ncbi:MAG: PRTRC system ThiF family protein [Acidobacteriaceae bacterium]